MRTRAWAYLHGRVWKRRDLAHLKSFKDDLFRRDVDNVQRHFERYGIEHHAGGRRTLADEIWERYYLPARVRPGVGL